MLEKLLLLATIALSSVAGAAAAPQPSREATLHKRQDNLKYEGYIFAYFIGENYEAGEQVYLAASVGNDLLNWQVLNGGYAILNSTLGEQGVRDPTIIRSVDGDKFWLIATDLKMDGSSDWDYATRYGSRYLSIWESEDLVSWSEQRLVEVSGPEAGNTWAPEATWSDELQVYFVVWASKLYEANDTEHVGHSYNRIMYSTTTDFVTFSEPQIYIDYNRGIIDTSFLRADNGELYRFNKDEEPGIYQYFTFQEVSSDGSLFGNWSLIVEGIGFNEGLEQAEGQFAFASNTEEGKYYLFVDDANREDYVPYETTDIAAGAWSRIYNASLPGEPRHGTVLRVTAEEHARVVAAYSV